VASEVDPSVFPDNEKVAKSALREQMEIIANEISALQLATSTVRRVAYDDAQFDTI
jgi:hypothetical protein